MQTASYSKVLAAWLLSVPAWCAAAEPLVVTGVSSQAAWGNEYRTELRAPTRSASGAAHPLRKNDQPGARDSNAAAFIIGKDPAAQAATGAAPASSPLPFQPTAPEAAVKRFRQEGFTAARLWQTDLCALNLGLNSKGKPGLWFIKKFR